MLLADAVGQTAEISGAVLLIVGIVVVVVTYFRASYAKATIETLKESNAALTERVDILESENERCSAELRGLKTENTNLRNYVSGTEAIGGLQSMITEQFRTITASIDDVKGLLNDRRQNP